MSRKEVIKLLKLIKSTVYLGNRKFLDALEFAINYLNQPEWRWIPVDERLPDTQHDDILVTYIDQFGAYVGQDEWQYGEFLYYGDKVIAWMPLPDPWDGGQKE
jgi:hypothetical protein